MLDKDILLVRIAEDARWTDAGKNDPIIRVEFRVGDHGPFVERFRKVDYTSDARDQKLNTFARHVRTP